jgi:colicin import membrane protein
VYFGLLVSVMLHASLLGWTVVSIQSTPELRVPVIEPIAVDMISPSELTRITKGSRSATLKEARANESLETEAAPKESNRPRPPVAQPPPPPAPAAPPEPPPPKPAEAAPPPPPPPAAAPPPPAPEPDRAALEQKLADLALQQADEAKRQAEAKAAADAKVRAESEAKAKAEAESKARAEAEAKAKAEADAKARAEADAKAKADAKRKADEAKRQAEIKRKQEEARQKRIADEKAKAQFNADRLAALLDKSPDQRAPAPAAPQPSTDTRAKGPVLGAREGTDATLSASKAGWLASLLSRAVAQCWNVPAGIAGLENVVVRLEVRLNRDGTLVGTPKVTNSENFPAFGLVADSAVRAMIACAPYSLPPDMYEGGWEHIVFAFRPPQ